MPIREYREAYKNAEGFEYPFFFEEYQKALASVWRPQEVSFESDIRDWQNASDVEREVVGGILRGFTQFECFVADYWSNIPNWFPKHEIAAVARMFSLSEVVHAEAYNLLSDTLGINEFEAFLGDPLAQAKLSYFLNEKGIKESLAIFSGAGEGVSLFSSFAVLLSLNLVGKYRGISQIISWSINDETQHSKVGIQLFRELVKEEPLTSEEERSIYEGFQAVVKNEIAFIRGFFKGRELDTIVEEDTEAFILLRANEKLTECGLLPIFQYDREKANNIKKWFYLLSSGNTSTDFFSQSKDGASYISKPTQDFTAVNLKALDYVLL